MLISDENVLYKFMTKDHLMGGRYGLTARSADNQLKLNDMQHYLINRGIEYPFIVMHDPKDMSTKFKFSQKL